MQLFSISDYSVASEKNHFMHSIEIVIASPEYRHTHFPKYLIWETSIANSPILIRLYFFHPISLWSSSILMATPRDAQA